MTPEEVVRGELAAWDRLDVDEIVSYFVPDAVFDNVPSEFRLATPRFVRSSKAGSVE